MNRIYDNFGCIPANHRICFVVILVTLSKVDKVSFIKSTLSYLVLVVILCYLVLVVNFILPCSCGQFYPTLYLWSTLSYLVLVVNFILYLVLVVNFILYLVLVVNVILPCTLYSTCGQLYPTLYEWSTLPYLVLVVNFGEADCWSYVVQTLSHYGPGHNFSNKMAATNLAPREQRNRFAAF